MSLHLQAVVQPLHMSLFLSCKDPCNLHRVSWNSSSFPAEVDYSYLQSAFCIRIYISHLFCHHNKYLRGSTWEGRRFILAHGFEGSQRISRPHLVRLKVAEGESYGKPGRRQITHCQCVWSVLTNTTIIQLWQLHLNNLIQSSHFLKGLPSDIKVGSSLLA